MKAGLLVPRSDCDPLPKGLCQGAAGGWVATGKDIRRHVRLLWPSVVVSVVGSGRKTASCSILSGASSAGDGLVPACLHSFLTCIGQCVSGGVNRRLGANQRTVSRDPACGASPRLAPSSLPRSVSQSSQLIGLVPRLAGP